MHTVTLKWDPAPTGQTLTDWEVFRALAPSGTFALLGKVTAPTYVDSDPTLKEGSSYLYEVKAENSKGESAPSLVVTVLIPFSVPTAPTGLVATVA